MAGNPIILTTTNFSNLFSEIYSILHPGAGENNSNIGKVLQIGSNGKATLTSDIVTGTGLSTLEARVSANESAITGKASSADLSALVTRVTATENSLSGKIDLGGIVTALNTTSPTAGSTIAKLQAAVQDHADTVIDTELGSTGTIGTALTSATANLASESYVTTAVTNAKTELSAVNADSGLANVLGFSKGSSVNLNGSDGTALSRSTVTNVKGYIDAGDSELSTKIGTVPTGTPLNTLKTNLGITASGGVDLWQAIQAISTKIGDSTAVKPSDLGMSTTYDS